MRVLVCGSRDWENLGLIIDALRQLPPKAIVIHGGARGADQMAAQFARQIGLHTAEVKPLWDHFGNRAGHVRNSAMLDLQPDRVIAFSLGTPGTQGTIDEARKRGIQVDVFAPGSSK